MWLALTRIMHQPSQNHAQAVKEPSKSLVSRTSNGPYRAWLNFKPTYKREYPSQPVKDVPVEGEQYSFNDELLLTGFLEIQRED
jgi:hypothetical protein